MGADTDSVMHVTDIIVHQWLSIPEYLHKRTKYMNMKVIVIEKTSSCQDISHEIWFLEHNSEGFRFNTNVSLRTLFPENTPWKWSETLNIYSLLYYSNVYRND